MKQNFKQTTQDIIAHAMATMEVNADAEAVIEGKTIQSAALSDAGMILRFTNGTKFTYTCICGTYNIEC